EALQLEEGKLNPPGKKFTQGAKYAVQENLSESYGNCHSNRHTLSEPDLNWLLPPRILAARHEGSCHHSSSGSRDAHGVCSGIERKEAGCVQAVYRAWRNANPYSYTA